MEGEEIKKSEEEVNVEDYVQPEAFKLLTQKGRGFQVQNKGVACIEKAKVAVDLGYNILKNQHFARMYIQKKYKIEVIHLELMLYYYNEVFTQKDYSAYPKDFNLKLGLMRKYGWIIKILRSNHYGQSVFQISEKGKKVVQEYYNLILGRAKFSNDPKKNPYLKSKDIYDKKKALVLDKINNMDFPDVFKTI